MTVVAGLPTVRPAGISLATSGHPGHAGASRPKRRVASHSTAVEMAGMAATTAKPASKAAM